MNVLLYFSGLLLQEGAQSGAQVPPGSSCGTPRAASHMKPQGSWSSEALSRQLEQDFSHAAPENGADKKGHHEFHSNGQPHATGETNGNGTPYGYVKGQTPVVGVQHPQLAGKSDA